MRLALSLVGLLVLAALVVLGPNLIWLARSTARITNESGRELRDVRLALGEREVVVGAAALGQSRFVFLPETGEATLSVMYWTGNKQRTGCQGYVEGSTYHVEIVVGQDLEAHCSTTLPIFDRLFWREAL